MAWITQSQLTTAAKSVVSIGAAQTHPTHWDELLAAAIIQSRGAIRRALAARGFTAAQTADWDDLYDFHRRIALCNFFREGGIAKAYDSIHLNEYCKALGELATVNVTIDGVLVEPGLTAGQCSYGDFDDSEARISLMEE